MAKTKSRGNGQGCVYRSKNGKSWVAQAVVDYRKPKKPGGQPIPVKRRKSGFSTKAEAFAYIPILKNEPDKVPKYSLKTVFENWQEMYTPRIVPSTMNCYTAAYHYFSAIENKKIAGISANDLQQCMDDCPRGKRTHQNMKVVAGLIWAYAMDCNYVEKDVTENLYIGKHETKQREPLTNAEIETIRSAIPSEPYASYVYALCYLGFRPGEFLSLKKTDLITVEGIDVLVGGSKTEAGRNRRVVVPPQIVDIVRERSTVSGTDLLFPQYCYSRDKKTFTGFKQMTDAYFREDVFKPMMQRLGIAEGKVPYGARHSYSDKLKNASGSNKAKADLMGHTDYAFTQSRYQSTDIDDLLDVATSLE